MKSNKFSYWAPSKWPYFHQRDLKHGPAVCSSGFTRISNQDRTMGSTLEPGGDNLLQDGFICYVLSMALGNGPRRLKA